MNSILEAIAKAAATNPDTVAVIAQGEQIVYRELWQEARGFAAYIQSLHLDKGARVVVKSKHAIWYIVACFGIQLAGCVHVPLEKTIGIEGLKNIVEQLSASLVISDVDMEDAHYQTVASSSVRDLASAHFREDLHFEFPAPEDLCDILFTTGTTGKPKGVMLSHGALVAVAENGLYSTEMSDGNVFLIPSPMNHAGGIRNVYLCMFTGTTAVLLDGYTNVKMFFEYIRDYHVTSIYMPPSAIRMMLMLASKELAKYAEQIQFIHTSSAFLPESDKERMCEIFSAARLYNGYGCSEAGKACVFDYAKERGKINCVGKPTHNTRILIVDDDRKEIQSSEDHPGLIAITGANMMSGYYNDPALTQETMEHGILYTNDIGYLDEDGYMYVLGRRGDVINIGGLKIAPVEVENIALRFPGIAECVCYAVEDKRGNINVKLNYVEIDGEQVDVSGLRKHIAQKLEAFKVPKLYEKVDAIPKTANGKIDRKALK